MQDILFNTKKSNELYKKACELIPGGVNSPVRSFKAVKLNPLFIAKAKGPYIWDADQNQYLDFVCSWGALIHGHIPFEITEQIQSALTKGISYGAPHENELELAQIIINKYPSIEKVRLVNSGTEAVMTAIRLARAYTKKDKIIKFSGCYHGHSDSVLSMSGSGIATLGIPSSPGITQNTASETITLPFNDLTSVEIALNKFSKEIAAVITEPIIGNLGVISPKEGFLKDLRDLTQKHKCLLIFDEVITGFRVSMGGAQEIYNVTPDLTTLGKIIGGGMPIGAIGGKKEIMDLLAPVGPVYQAGTLSGNPLSVACGIASLKLLTKETYQYLEQISYLLCEGIENINQEMDNSVQVNRVGSMFSIFFSRDKVYDYDSAKKTDTEKFAEFFKNMLSNRIYLAPSQFEANFISTSHKEEDIQKALATYKKSLKATLNFR